MAAATEFTGNEDSLARQRAILAAPPGGTRLLANAIRVLAIDAVEAAKSGHPGMPMGMADVATVLWTRHLKYDAADPAWPDRDRFILSAGHGSMLLYALLYLAGFEGMTAADLGQFRQLHAVAAGHPERGEHPAIEMTTGPLGQGISTAVGLALGERMMAARFGDALVDHHTWVIASDGDMMEGVSHEACALAGHLRLHKLIVLYDDNAISIDGSTAMSMTENVLLRFEAYGWAAVRIDGHDPAQIDAAMTAAKRSEKPTLIACKTIIGFGAPSKAGTAGAHGSALGAAEAAAAKELLGWPAPPFEIPEEILAPWREAGGRGASARAAWVQRLSADAAGVEFSRVQNGDPPPGYAEAMAGLRARITDGAPDIATRQASQMVLDAIIPVMPELVGGSADLTPSNNTFVKSMGVAAPGEFGGRYIHFGVREHGMAACLNGLALHGGLVPYGGTFFVFSDYCRPAIRLAALMRLQSIFVLTHDSIGLGEDGPTHQPVEHLAAFRAMPNVLVLRPGDALETAECWDIALRHKTGPSLLILSRQAMPSLPARLEAGNLAAKGGYIAVEAAGERAATLIATGSEVTLAISARNTLAEQGVAVAVVSVPSFELFASQSAAYRAEVLGVAPRIGIEAASRFGWADLIGEAGLFIGMKGFGASAPYQKLYEHFGITAAVIVAAVMERRRQ